MAITQDDFKKVWASTSSVPEYTFSDTDYKNGWEFVGNLPPTRAMWDELQRKNDEKMQFLQENGSMCFDSVADMKSSNLDAGQTAFTKGYYSINDGGSAVYTIRAKTQEDVDDGGSIIFLENGNVAERVERIQDYANNILDVINVKRNPFVSIIKDGSYISSQGMCVAGDYLIETHFANDNVATRYYVIDIPTKTIKGYYDILTNHSNNLTYNKDDGCVYTAYLNSIYKLRLTAEGVLSLEDTIPLTGLYAVSAIAYNDGVFYVRGVRQGGETHRQIFKTTDFVTYDYLYTVDFGMDGQTLQGMEVDKHFLYMPTSGSDSVERIFIFDKTRGELIRVYEIPRKTYGEIEDVDIYNGQIAINFNVGDGGCVYLCPLVRTQSNLNPLASINGTTVKTGDDEIYVDNSNVVAFPDGTATNPFNSWAVAVAITEGENAPYQIHISGNYDSFYLLRRKNLLIKFENANISGKLIVQDCNNIIIVGNWTANGMEVTRSILSLGTGGVLDGGSSAQYAIYAGDSLVTGRLTIQNYTTGIMYGGGSVVNITATITNTPFVLPNNSNSVLMVNNTFYDKSNFIPSNGNLNDYILPGARYYCQTTTTASTLANCPTSDIFVMEVYRRDGGSDVFQRIIDDAGKIYTRRNSGTSWSGWKTISPA